MSSARSRAAALWGVTRARFRTTPVGRWLAPVTLTHWSWIHFKVSIVVWAIFYWMFTPAATIVALDATIRITWLTCAIAGAMISVAGMLMSLRESEWMKKRGVQTEVSGLSLMAVGPLVYFTTQLSLALGPVTDLIPRPTDRLGTAWLGYVVLAAILGRLAVVIPRYRKEVKEMSTAKERRAAEGR